MRCLAGLLLSACMFVQDQPASVHGVVKDAGSGEPVPGATVTLYTGVRMLNSVMNQSKDTQELTSVTDAHGKYSFNAAPAGGASISARGAKREFASGVLTLKLKAGEELTYDIAVHVNGTISGKVLDESGEPVPGMTVFLVGREYFAGAIRTLIKSTARTNDAGEYTLETVSAGRQFLVYAANRPMKQEAISPLPLDAKVRRQVLAAAFYPNSRDIAGAASLTLRSRERLEGIDIKMAKSPGFCVEATVERAGVPGPIRFEIAVQEPSLGMGARGGLVGPNPGGIASADGRIRICELTAGHYTLDAMDAAPNGTPALGRITFVIDDRDVTGLKVAALPAQPVAGEVVLEGEAPPEPVKGNLLVALNPLGRASFMGENRNARAPVPVKLTLPAALEGEYSLFPPLAPDGYYVKDITYAGESVLGRTVRVAGIAAALRVIVAPGAASINAAVVDGQGKPAAGVTVVAMPAGVPSEAALAELLVRSSTDQDGNCMLYRMPPGKYHVIAFTDDVDMTPQQMTKLWQARTSRAEEVEVGPSGAVAVQLKAGSLK